jgi:hypothetical protein
MEQRRFESRAEQYSGRISLRTRTRGAEESNACGARAGRGGHHPRSGAGAIGRIAIDVPSGLSLTPPQETELIHPGRYSYMSEAESTPGPSAPEVTRH